VIASQESIQTKTHSLPFSDLKAQQRTILYSLGSFVVAGEPIRSVMWKVDFARATDSGFDEDRFRAIGGRSAGDDDVDGGEGKGTKDGEIDPAAEAPPPTGTDIEIGTEADDVLGVTVWARWIISDEDGEEGDELAKGTDEVKGRVRDDAVPGGEAPPERGELPLVGEAAER
jgi:hypothetical protein